MDPRLFLAHATRMLAEKKPEANRSAVSRSYYAVFHVTAQLMDNLSQPLPRGPAAHGEAQHRLANCKDNELELLANQLSALHRRRLQADYRLVVRDIEDDRLATDLVGQASSMIVVLDACRRDVARLERVKAGIEAYLAGSGRNGA